MDIGWAVRALENGEKIRRTSWDGTDSNTGNGGYLRVELERREGYHPELIATLRSGAKLTFRIDAYQFLAKDWELA